MITLSNFKPYVPKDNAIAQAHPEVGFLMCDEGIDWYESQKDFQADTLKMAVDATGLVKQVSTDVTGLWPNGWSVIEISPDKFPEVFVLGQPTAGQWVYTKGKFVAVEKTAAYKLKVKKAKLTDKMVSAKEIIDSLRIEKEYSELTEEKAEQLKNAARDYISAKNELEASDGSDN